MNNEHIKGAVNTTKGKVKEEVGHFSGNDSLAGEGIIDQVKGKIQEGLGDLKDSLKKGVDSVLSNKKH